MRIRVPILTQDLEAARQEHFNPIEYCSLSGEDFYLDGPLTRRLAVLDFDPADGSLRPGVPFLQRRWRNFDGAYRLNKPYDPGAADFLSVSAFGTVASTMAMFEESDVLGRQLNWAFNAPQLFIVPRAGVWENAFYERESHSLQFFFFPGSRAESEGRTIYTAMSHDIVAHEAAHAILDGIARDLYHAVSPQSLALHEAVADLSAALMAFRCKNLAEYVLKKTGGSIRDSSLFSSLAEEFGSELPEGSRVGYLRSLINQKTLNPEDRSLDVFGRPNYVGDTSEPHELSQVLSGALYQVLIKIYEKALPESETSGLALYKASEQFKRMILRALDYLPPGEVSFLDYARAILAADRVCNPHSPDAREWLRSEFMARGIAASRDDFKVETDYAFEPLQTTNLQTLIDSDWAAYQFAHSYRDFLKIEKDANIYVRPRLDVSKRHFHLGRVAESVRECILKVSWDVYEENQEGLGLPRLRQITVGTMLAINRDTRRVNARITSMYAPYRAERDRFLHHLMDEGLLQIIAGPETEEQSRFTSRVRAEVLGEVMRVRGSARLLHIVRGE